MHRFGTRRGLLSPRQIAIADWLFSLPGSKIIWPFQELSGVVAGCRNDALALGRDVVINGDFASDTVWTKGANWTIAAGVATHAAGATATLKQSGIAAAGKTWSVTFTVSNRTAGTITPKIGASGTARSTNNTFTETITATGADLEFVPTTDFDGNIDNVSVKQTNIAASSAFPGAEELSEAGDGTCDKDNWTAGASATLTNPSTNLLRIARNGVNDPSASQVTLVIGKRYRLTGECRSDGNAIPKAYGSATFFTGTTSTDWQTIDNEWTATGTTFGIYSNTSTGTEYTEWRNLSVTEANPLNGDISGATIAQTCGLPGLPYCYSFDGSNDYVNLYSAELNSCFDPTAGSLGIAFKADTWAAGTDYLAILGVDANNKIEFYRNGSNIVAVYKAGGTAETFTIASGSPAGWNLLELTWEAPGNAIAYLNGAAETPQAIGGTWVGNFASTLCVIGAEDTTPANDWAGDAALVYLFNRARTQAEISQTVNMLGLG